MTRLAKLVALRDRTDNENENERHAAQLAIARVTRVPRAYSQDQRVGKVDLQL